MIRVKRIRFKLRCLNFLLVFSGFFISEKTFAINPFSHVLRFFSHQRFDQKLDAEFLTASSNYDINKLQKLLQQGANLNAKDDYGNTALHIAAKENHLEIAQLLLKEGTNPNIKNYYDDTPLHIAVIGDHLQMVQLLLKGGANPHIKNYYGNTPLHIAALRNTLKTSEFLLNKGANLNIKNKDGNTPLNIAVRENYLETAQLLLKKGANLNIKNKNGDTPLHRATAQNFLEITKLLLKKGANPNVKNKDDQTPLQLAINNQSLECIASLLNAEADLFLDFKSDNNPLKLVLQSENLDMMYFIFNHKAFSGGTFRNKKLKLIEFAMKHSTSRESIELLLASEKKIPLEVFIERTFLKKALELFENQNKDIPNLWSTQETVSSIDLQGIDIFISLLLRYRYKMQHKIIPNSVKKLAQKFSNLRIRITDNYYPHQIWLESAKSLIHWITNQMPSTRSSEEFFKKIFQYLRNKNHSPEEQNLLLKKIQHLILKEYFLNPNISDKSDFKKLKKKLKNVRLNNFQRFENNLRYTYAKELKIRFFSFLSEEDLRNLFEIGKKTNQQNDLSIKLTLKKFSLINHLVESMNSYCQNMLYAIPSARMINNVSPLIGEFLEKAQVLQNEIMIKWIQFMPDNKSSSMLSLIENFLEQGYNQPIGKQLQQIYQHLEHIIQTEGADINSNTSLTGKDILALKK